MNTLSKKYVKQASTEELEQELKERKDAVKSFEGKSTDELHELYTLDSETVLRRGNQFEEAYIKAMAKEYSISLEQANVIFSFSYQEKHSAYGDVLIYVSDLVNFIRRFQRSLTSTTLTN